jgi:hypothetical protein
MPTWDSAVDTPDCAGPGSEPVAAAATPAVRARAGMAIPAALSVSNFPIIDFLLFRAPVGESMPPCSRIAALTRATISSRAVRSAAVAGALASRTAAARRA